MKLRLNLSKHCNAVLSSTLLVSALQPAFAQDAFDSTAATMGEGNLPIVQTTEKEFLHNVLMRIRQEHPKSENEKFAYLLLRGMVETRLAHMKPTSLVAVDRESSLHPEHDPLSPSYSGRRSPGPVHGKDPHGADPNGEDPHDEVHDKGLPANEEQAKYYPHSLLNNDSKPVDPKLEKDDPPDNNDLKKQAPISSDKKRVSDLIPTEPKPL